MNPPLRPIPTRLWFRLSLRTWMVLIVVIAVPIGWLARQIHTQRQAIAAVVAAGGTIGFIYHWQDDPATGMKRTEPAAPRWLRRWLGDELFQSVYSVTYDNVTTPDALVGLAAFDRLEVLSLEESSDPSRLFPVEVDWRPVQGLQNLHSVGVHGRLASDRALGEFGRVAAIEYLWIDRAPATAAGFARLADCVTVRSLNLTDCPGLDDRTLARLVPHLPRLDSVWIDNSGRVASTLPALARHTLKLENVLLGARTGITDDDLRAIGGITQLKSLDLRDLQITDAGLAHLARLTRLTDLDLTGCPAVTDAGLAHLHGLPALVNLRIYDSQITPTGIAALRQAVPTLKIDATTNPITPLPAVPHPVEDPPGL